MTLLRCVLKAAILFAGLFAAPAAWACSCGLPDDTDKFVADIGVIFEGTMVREAPLLNSARCNGFGCERPVEGVFVVRKVYKGTVGSEVRLVYTPQDGGNCGPTFQPNAPTTIAAYEVNGILTTNMCTQGAVWSEPFRSQILASAARYRQKLDELDAAIEENPQNAKSRLDKAHYLYETNDKNGALAIASDVIGTDQSNKEAVLLAARILQEAKKDDDAMALTERFLTQNPEDTDVTQARVTSLVRLGRMAEVPADWKDFSNLAADHADFSGRTLDGAALKAMKLGSAFFRYVSLKGADFSGTKITNVQFDHADLEGANLINTQISGTFSNANLKGAQLVGLFKMRDSDGLDMSGADIRGASFNGSFSHVKAVGVSAVGVTFGHDMAGTDFSGANLQSSIFYSANLSGASFEGADLTDAKFLTSMTDSQNDVRGADFTDAKLENVNFNLTIYDCSTKWPAGFDIKKHPRLIPAPGSESCGGRADFSWIKEPNVRDPMARIEERTSFVRMNLDGISFRGSYVPGEYFWNASLRGADFSRVKGKIDLRGADASGADFSYVDFTKSNLYGVNGPAAILDGAKFRGAILPRQAFTGGDEPDFPAPDLSKANLQGAIFPDDPARWPATIDPVAAGVVFRKGPDAKTLYPNYGLKGADLRGFDLSNADFTGIDLAGADLRGAYLYEVKLRNANTDGIKWKGSCYAESTRWPEGFDLAASGTIFCGRVDYHYGSPIDGFLSSGWSNSNGGLAKEANWYLAPADTPVPDFAHETWDEAMWLAAWLPGSRLDGGSFVHAVLKGANLNGASLLEANLTGADLQDALIEGANLSGANLKDADLRKASLKGSNLSGAVLTGALFDDQTTWPDGFDAIKAGALKE